MRRPGRTRRSAHQAGFGLPAAVNSPVDNAWNAVCRFENGVMGVLKSKLAGRADMAAISARVREGLAAKG